MLHLARYISYYLVEYLVVQSAIYVGLRNDLETFNVAWRYVPNQWKLNTGKVQWICGIQQCRTYNPKLRLYSQASEAQTCPCKNGFYNLNTHQCCSVRIKTFACRSMLG